MKISPTEYQDFLHEYFTTRKRVERFGQAFINKFFVDNMTNPELFYSENYEVARDIIINNYIDWEV